MRLGQAWRPNPSKLIIWLNPAEAGYGDNAMVADRDCNAFALARVH